MRRIEVQKLSAEKFCRYGEYQDLLNDASLAKKSIFPGGFFADVVKLDLGTTTLPTVSVCQVRKSEQMVVSMVEAHKFTCEGLLPLDDDIVLFAGIPYPGRKLSSGPLEAFFVPKGTFVRLNPLIVHGTQCFLQALFPQKCRLTSSKLHGEFPQYCISSAGTLSGAGEEPLQAYKVY